MWRLTERLVWWMALPVAMAAPTVWRRIQERRGR